MCPATWLVNTQEVLSDRVIRKSWPICVKSTTGLVRSITPLQEAAGQLDWVTPPKVIDWAVRLPETFWSPTIVRLSANVWVARSDAPAIVVVNQRNDCRVQKSFPRVILISLAFLD